MPTPVARLAAPGFGIAAYPLTLLSAAAAAMQKAVAGLAEGEHADELLLEFAQLRRVVGFDACYAAEQRYTDSEPC